MKAKVSAEASFKRELKRLPPHRSNAAIEALSRFMNDPARPGLDFRPLKGKAGHFIIDAGPGDRIILRKEDEGVFAAVDIGPHDNVYRRWKRR